MTSKEILIAHSLRHTNSRSDILEVFLQRNSALSQPELEKEMHECDRVTIYRTLATFLEKGILHKVLDDAGAMKYALCSHIHCSEHYHSHDHVHFKCNQCNRTLCLENLHIPPIKMPQSFLVEEVNLLIQGVCEDCCATAQKANFN